MISADRVNQGRRVFRRPVLLEHAMKWVCLFLVAWGLFGCAGAPPDRYKSTNTERPRKGEEKVEKK